MLFFLIISSPSVRRPERRETPPHTRRRRRRRRHTVASNVGGGSGALQQAQAGRPIVPRPARRCIPLPNPSPSGSASSGGIKGKHAPKRRTHPSPASPHGASCGGATRVPAAGPRGADCRPRLPRGGGQRAGLVMVPAVGRIAITTIATVAAVAAVGGVGSVAPPSTGPTTTIAARVLYGNSENKRGGAPKNKGRFALLR